MTQENNKQPYLSKSSDEETAFEQMTSPHHYELLVHCYRILGSVEDAEDGLQETLLRAWNRLDQLHDPSAFRAWLYKIATNVSLDMLKSCKVRSLPHVTYPPADPLQALPLPDANLVWLDPLPDFYFAELAPGPEQKQIVSENVTLAFLVVLQQLPGRQRAVLLLRDVLEWKASEVADALDMTVAAVNSALQRARTTLKKYQDQASADEMSNIDGFRLLPCARTLWQK